MCTPCSGVAKGYPSAPRGNGPRRQGAQIGHDPVGSASSSRTERQRAPISNRPTGPTLRPEPSPGRAPRVSFPCDWGSEFGRGRTHRLAAEVGSPAARMCPALPRASSSVAGNDSLAASRSSGDGPVHTSPRDSLSSPAPPRWRQRRPAQAQGGPGQGPVARRPAHARSLRA